MNTIICNAHRHRRPVVMETAKLLKDAGLVIIPNVQLLPLGGCWGLINTNIWFISITSSHNITPNCLCELKCPVIIPSSLLVVGAPGYSELWWSQAKWFKFIRKLWAECRDTSKIAVVLLKPLPSLCCNLMILECVICVISVFRGC